MSRTDPARRVRQIGRCAARVALSSILLMGPVAVPARATPPVAATSVVLSEHTVDGKDYIASVITIAPRGSTGWHTHRGLVYGVVMAGTLTHYGKDCHQDGVYGPGAALTDPAGADHAHLGRNLTAEPVVLQVTYVDLADAPTSDDAPNPGCGFA